MRLDGVGFVTFLGFSGALTVLIRAGLIQGFCDGLAAVQHDAAGDGPRRGDGVVTGRDLRGDGSGVLAARIVAGHDGEIGLMLTSDEEGAAIDGVRRVAEVLQRRGRRPDYCLVGEPSSRITLGDTVRIGRRGSLYLRLRINGVQGHTAFPENLDNPVHRMAPFLADLTTEQWDRGDDDFPASHCQVSSLRAGTGAGNVTPAYVELLANVTWMGDQDEMVPDEQQVSPAMAVRRAQEISGGRLLEDVDPARVALVSDTVADPFLTRRVEDEIRLSLQFRGRDPGGEERRWMEALGLTPFADRDPESLLTKWLLELLLGADAPEGGGDQ